MNAQIIRIGATQAEVRQTKREHAHPHADGARLPMAGKPAALHVTSPPSLLDLQRPLVALWASFWLAPFGLAVTPRDRR